MGGGAIAANPHPSNFSIIARIVNRELAQAALMEKVNGASCVVWIA